MPDIREILNALSVDDKALWSEKRTAMRHAYLNAHNETVGMANWDANDDAFMDLIDIKLAILFDRAGKLIATKEIIGSEHVKIEEEVKEAIKDVAVPLDIKPLPKGTTLIPHPSEKLIQNQSEASKMLAGLKIDKPIDDKASLWPESNKQ